MSDVLESGGSRLEVHIARPASLDAGFPGLVLCHGFPSGVVNGSAASASFPELADRIAAELGWVVLTFSFRGAGKSEGDFSLGNWLADIDAAVDHLSALERVEGVWLAGYGTGGALCVCAGSRRSDVQGVAALAAPADFDDWASHPRRLLQHAREMDLITSAGFPRSMEAWSRELKEIRPARAVTDLAPRDLLIVHGSEDDAVPQFDARIIVDAHGSAEMRIISGAGHQLRYDPRAVAVLMGWLDRQKHRVRA